MGSIPESKGSEYYRYTWLRGTDPITIEGLVRGTARTFTRIGSIPVPESVRIRGREGQEVDAARIIYADMRERFGEIADWITCNAWGAPFWFHKEVTGN